MRLARQLLEEHRDKVEAMTQALLEWETLDSDQIDDIMASKAPRPPKPLQSQCIRRHLPIPRVLSQALPAPA
jgi:hypothetical protein